AEIRRQVEVFNSEGLAASDDRTRVRLSAQVVARRDGTVETGQESRGGHAGFELVAESPQKVAEAAARKALTLLDARDAPSGPMPVVVGKGFGGVLLHEAVGHGRESFRHLPIPRMTNTYFAPGDATPDDLIGSVERGLYAVSFGGGQVEPATGDFVFGVSEGYLIENGKVTAPVRGATLIGNGIEA